MRRMSPIARLSQRVHGTQRTGLAGLMQRVVVVILPPPAPPPSTALEPSPPEAPAPPLTPEQTAARERARRALIDARRTMSGVIGEEVISSDDAGETSLTAVTPDLERLQTYLEESERERAELKEELTGLQQTVRLLQTRLDGLERALPAPAATTSNGAAPVAAEGEASDAQSEAPGTVVAEQPEPVTADHAVTVAEEGAEQQQAAPSSMPVEDHALDEAQVREMRERVLRALRERVFAAGTVGTRVQLLPAPTEGEFAEIVDRFNQDPLVEHAEPVEAGEKDAAVAQVRVALRAPLRWEQFGALLERALGLPIPHDDVRWSQGAVQVRLAQREAIEAQSSAPDAAEPCA